MRHMCKSGQKPLLSLLSGLVWLGLFTLGSGTVWADATSTNIVPQHFLRSYDTVTVVFAKDLGPAKPKAEDQGAKYLAFQPAVPGAYRWLDSKTLEFRPSQPWPALQHVRAFVPKGLKHGGKVVSPASRILRTLLPSPTQLSPRQGESDVVNLKKIAITFPRPLPTEALGQSLRVEIRRLPGLEATRPDKVLRSGDWWLKRRNRHNGPTTYWLVLKNDLPKARHITVRLQLALSMQNSSQPLPFWTSTFRTQKPFRLSQVTCGSDTVTLAQGRSRYMQEQALNCASGNSEVPTLVFTRTLGTNNPGVLRRLIRVSPTVASVKIRVRDNHVQIHGSFQRATLYRLTVQAGSLPIRDDAGQLLQHQGQQTVFFYQGKKTPLLQWDQHRGLVERFGPQMMPIQLRGLSKVDLRIYAIKPGDNRFWAATDSSFQVDENTPPQGEGSIPKNPGATLSLPTQHIHHYLRSLGTPAVSKVVALPKNETSKKARLGLNLAPYLKSLLPKNAKDSARHFLVGVRRLDGSTQRHYALVQVTDLALASVEQEKKVRFVVTSLQTGKPVANAKVEVQGIQGTPQKRTWQTLWSGTTNAQGFAVLDAPNGLKGKPVRLKIQHGNDVLVVRTQKAPPVFLSSHWWPSYKSWLSWLNYRSPRPLPHNYRAHLFTERPVYRPGEAVHIKGIVRSLKEGRLQLPNIVKGKKDLQLVVIGPKGQRWIYNNLKLTAMGGIYKKFDTKRAPSGYYRAHLYSKHLDGRHRYLASRNFRVEAYRIPRFEVKVLAKGREPADKPFVVRALAKYYAGGLVVERPIKWRVTQRVISFRPALKQKGFVFASSYRFSQGPRRRTQLVLDRTTTIDKQGQAALKIDPTLNLDLHARRYSVEATVRGTDGREISGYRSILVLPPFNIGVKLDGRFRQKPGTLKAQLIAVGVNGKLVKDVPLTVTLMRREWHSHLVATDFVGGGVKYKTEVVDSPVARCTVSTKTMAVTCPVAAKKSGVYILRVQGKDKLGRTQSLSIDMYVRGNDQMAWARSKKAVFKLSTDKTKYFTGQTAQVLVRSPFQTARALVIVEDPAGARYHWMDITKGQGVFRMPVERRYAPSLPLHVILMRGRVAQPSKTTQLDPGRPRTLASSLRLNVDPKQNRVMVAMKLPRKARPRQMVEVEIQLKSPEGQPVAGEVTLWAVDRAVLSLGREQRIHPLRSFVRERSVSIRYRDTRNMMVGRLPQRAERSGGGGGDGGHQNRTILRKNFKSVPYYNPAITVGTSGRVKVRFRLPDDLTTFQVRAVAVSESYRFGYKAKNLLVRLPVMIQRTLPRFVRPGDRFLSGGVGRVAEGKGGLALATVKAKGLVVTDKQQRKLTLPQRKAVPVFFSFQTPYRFQTDVSVKMGLIRLADKEQDAFQIKLPVQPDRKRIFVVKEQMVARLGAPLSMLSQWPEAIREGSGQAEILFAGRGELLRTAAAMEYLMEYPYGCTEQQVSRAYPLMVLRNTLKQFAYKHTSTAASQRAIQNTLDHLGTVQSRRGLFGYWNGSNGDIGLTAYTVNFLLEARAAGYKYPSSMLTRALRALRSSLRSDLVGALNARKLQLRADTMVALSMARWHEPAYMRKLYSNRNRLDLYGRSRLLLAMTYDQTRHRARINKLTRELEGQMVLRQVVNGKIYASLRFARKEGWYGSNLSSKTRTLASVLEALTRANPNSKMIEPLQAALLDRQVAEKNGYGWQVGGESLGWGSTQNNARALLAIRALLERKKTRSLAKYAFATYNKSQSQWSQPISMGGNNPSLWPFVIKTDLPPQLKVTGPSSNEPIWVRMRLSYLPKVRGSEVKSLNRGLALVRSTTVVGKTKEDNRYFEVKAGTNRKVPFGAVLEESVRIVNGQGHAHVAVEVPLPAGVEVMNPNLMTASSQSKTSQQNTIRPTHTEFLDDRVRYFFNYLPSGDHRLYFRVRATTSGQFTYPPAHAELMYRPSVMGRSAGYPLTVQPAK
ncbi:MAG: hypothetical protein EP343_30785 [Deltaproteobacteria bacterium]|nr:MAG: hypothetical protein EP343_30785 [Deltaproteobacteria bacterium]